MAERVRQTETCKRPPPFVVPCRLCVPSSLLFLVDRTCDAVAVGCFSHAPAPPRAQRELWSAACSQNKSCVHHDQASLRRSARRIAQRLKDSNREHTRCQTTAMTPSKVLVLSPSPSLVLAQVREVLKASEIFPF